jgi:hypothetical protein
MCCTCLNPGGISNSPGSSDLAQAVSLAFHSLNLSAYWVSKSNQQTTSRLSPKVKGTPLSRTTRPSMDGKICFRRQLLNGVRSNLDLTSFSQLSRMPWTMNWSKFDCFAFWHRGEDCVTLRHPDQSARSLPEQSRIHTDRADRIHRGEYFVHVNLLAASRLDQNHKCERKSRVEPVRKAS